MAILTYLLTGSLVAIAAQRLQENHSKYGPFAPASVLAIALLWPLYVVILLGTSMYVFGVLFFEWILEQDQ